MRCLDLNPFLPVGIDEIQARFLNLFLLYCLLKDSPPDSREESRIMGENQLAVVERGRQPDLMLKTLAGPASMQDWARRLMNDIRPLAALLDSIDEDGGGAIAGGDAYASSLEEAQAKLADPALTPSARLLDVMRSQKIPYFRFTLNQSIAHKGYFDEHPLRDQTLAAYERIAEESLARQSEIERADSQDFDTFLKDYLSFQ